MAWLTQQYRGGYTQTHLAWLAGLDSWLLSQRNEALAD